MSPKIKWFYWLDFKPSNFIGATQFLVAPKFFYAVSQEPSEPLEPVELIEVSQNIWSGDISGPAGPNMTNINGSPRTILS